MLKTTIHLKWRLLSGVAVWGLAALMTACQPAEADTCELLHSDFEEAEAPDHPLHGALNGEQAYNGKFSYSVPTGSEYGPALQSVVGKCGFVPSSLRLRGRAYLTSGRVRSTQLVVEVRCQGRRPDVWQAFSVDQVVRRYQQWESITKTIPLPDDLVATDEVRLYVWHLERDGEPTYLDDITLEGRR